MNANTQPHFILFAVSFLLLTASEYLMKRNWSSFYFMRGPLLLSKRYTSGTDPRAGLTAKELQEQLRRATGKSVAFGEVGDNGYGFRTSLLQLGLFMRIDKGPEGLLVFTPDHAHAEMRIHLNWVSLALQLIMVIALLWGALSDLPDSLFTLGSFLLLIQLMDALFAGAAVLEFKRGSRDAPALFEEIGALATGTMAAEPEYE